MLTVLGLTQRDCRGLLRSGSSCLGWFDRLEHQWGDDFPTVGCHWPRSYSSEAAGPSSSRWHASVGPGIRSGTSDGGGSCEAQIRGIWAYEGTPPRRPDAADGRRRPQPTPPATPPAHGSGNGGPCRAACARALPVHRPPPHPLLAVVWRSLARLHASTQSTYNGQALT